MDALDWILYAINMIINIPQFYAPWPFVAYLCGYLPDNYESRTHLRKICYYMNLKHIVGITTLLIIHFALERNQDQFARRISF